MHVVDLRQAEQHLPQLVEEAAPGDRIVIASDGKPLAMLSAYVEPAGNGLPLWQGTVTGALSRRDVYDSQDGRCLMPVSRTSSLSSASLAASI